MHMSANETHTTNGVIKAIAWLQAMGRPILAAKMERELLYVEMRASQGFFTPSPNEKQSLTISPSLSERTYASGS